uniref:Uncharacterized protein n=1 Tax=Knipowitschia caucasica TaxID=637954 RepID=A0AAV2L6M4_KNICA
MEEKQEKCDILSLGELMFQFNSPGVPHDETETQLKTEQTSSCEPAKNQEPAPQSCLNQEPAPQSCLNKEPAPQSCLNQEPAPPSSLTKPGPKKKRKQKPAKNLQGGLEEPKTPIKSFSTSERGKSPPIAPAQASLSNTKTQQVKTIRNNLPSDEQERYSLPSDAPFVPLHLIPDQGSTKIIQNPEISSQWDTAHISILAWEVSRHILQEKHLSVEHPLVMKLCQQLEEQMLDWNVKESPKHNKKIACDIYRDLCSKKRNKLMNFSALVTEDESDTIITEIHNHLVRPKKSSKLSSFFQSLRHALCRHC